MRVRDVIKAPKENIVTAPWRQGAIPPSAFMMRRDQKKRDLGASWWWRTIDFEAFGKPCRILIQLHAVKQSCSFTLGIHDDIGMLRLVCVREFHLSEPGWHCHSVLTAENGVRSFAHHGVRRFPKKEKNDEAFGVELRTATALAAKFYCLVGQGELL
jgi:hypothetical protein